MYVKESMKEHLYKMLTNTYKILTVLINILNKIKHCKLGLLVFCKCTKEKLSMIF